MGEFLAYSILGGIVLSLLYLGYFLFLAGDKQYGFNRGVLIMIYLISFFSFPLIGLTQKLVSPEMNLDISGEVLYIPISPLHPSNSVFTTLLIWVFLIGIGVTFLHTLLTVVSIIRTIKSGERIKLDGSTLIVSEDTHLSPFSWLNYIVMSREDYENNFQTIAIHEMVHIANRHWIDLLIAQFACIINWFNPCVWIMRRQLMLIHEFQADQEVLSTGIDPQQYQLLLITKAAGCRFPSLANSLNHSKLKKRITMMYKEKSRKGSKCKALALLPMLALSLCLTEITPVRAAVSAISNSSLNVSKDNQTSANKKTSVRVYKVTNLNNNGNKTTVTIKGQNVGDHMTVSGGTFTTNGKSYEAKALQCTLTDGEALITAEFPFISEFENSRMTLIINGEELPFNLEKFLHSGVVASKSNIGAMDYYLDGKKISSEDINSIDPSTIKEMKIDKQKNAIYITTKN